MIKNPLAMWETWVRSLVWEDPLEEGMATHSSILAWRILWTEEPGGLQSMESQRVGHNWATKHSTVQSLNIQMMAQASGGWSEESREVSEGQKQEHKDPPQRQKSLFSQFSPGLNLIVEWCFNSFGFAIT